MLGIIGLLACGDAPTPELVWVQPDPAVRYYEGRSLPVQVQVQRADSLRWSADGRALGGLPQRPSAGQAVGDLQLGAGSYTLEVVAESEGGTARAQWPLRVLPPNTAPTCRWLPPVPSPSGWAAEVRVSDAEQPVQTLDVTLRGLDGQVLAEGRPDESGAFRAELSSDLAALRVEVRDEADGVCTLEASLDALRLALVAPAAGQVLDPTQPVRFAAQVSGVSAPATVVLRWEQDGDLLLEPGLGQPNAMGEASFQLDDLVPGTYELRVTATPVEGEVVEALHTWRLDALPTAPEFRLEQPGDLLAVVEVPASDPDGDALTLVWGWTVDGAPTPWSTERVPVSALAEGQVWEATVRAFDGFFEGPSARAQWVVSPLPQVAGVEVVPRSPVAGDLLRCAFVGEGSVAWTRDGVAAGEGALLEAPAEAGERVSCTVTPRDEVRSGLPVASTEVRVADARPAQNVLLVVADDLGVDKLAVYGFDDDLPATPALDELAREGVRFTHVYTSPTCSPGRANLLTGRNNAQTLIGHALHFRANWWLQPEEVTLAEWLAPAGVSARFVGKWHLGSMDDPDFYQNPVDQGFQYFAGQIHAFDSGTTADGLSQNYFSWEKVTNGAQVRTDTYLTTDNADEALLAVSTLPEPWLVVLAFGAPHPPYHTPPGPLWSGDPTGPAASVQQYHAMVEAMDTELGRVLAAIDPVSTTVLFTADNGTPEGGVSFPGFDVRAKETVYELGTHVPLLVRSPWIDEVGAEARVLAQGTDLFATVAELAGRPLGPADLPDRDTRSLVPWLRDPGRPGGRETVHALQFSPPGPAPEAYEYFTAMVRDAEFKLVRDAETGDELYDLRGRLLEGEDLLASGAPLSAEARAAYDRLVAALPVEVPSL